MKHGFYFRFYKILHNEVLCCLLSSLAYFLYCCKFYFTKIFSKKTAAELAYDEALNAVNEAYPMPVCKPEYNNPERDENIDLSVVIPVYNYAEILEDNIKSILNQKTSYNYEVIFVDDGSTDGARDILKKYESNPKVKLIFKENGGIGSARNTGIDASSGRYLMFIDCDDTVHDDIVETLMSEAYKNDCDMVMAGHNLVKEKNGQVISVIPNVYPQKNLIGYKNGDEIMNYAGLPWAKVYKRELWDDVRFFPGYWYEDTIIQFLIFPKCKKFSYIPKIVYEYKWYEKNFSHIQSNASNVRTIERYWLLVEIINRYKENSKDNLSDDKVFYTLLLRHITCYYYPFIKDLDTKLVEALFVCARQLFLEYKPKDKVKLPYVLKQAEKAFDKNDMELWKLSSLYQ